MTNTVKTKTAIIIPTYNNEKTVKTIIDEVKTYSCHIIVINDGSTDSTTKILKNISDITQISFPENRGKGIALQAGFEKAHELGYKNAITIDSDGQHLTDEIPIFLAKIEEEPETLWIGNRILPYDRGVEPPKKSSFGRSFGNFWYKFIANIKLSDTQCGFRAYPITPTLAINSKRKRYEYEQELLIRSAWNGTPIKEVAIKIYYQPTNEKVTHFRPFKDFIRISRVNSRYATIRIVNPFVVLDVPGNNWKEKIRYLAKKELKANTTSKKAATSVAFGVFWGLSPFHGVQVILTMGLSYLFHLNRPLAFLGVSISSAPMLPFIIFTEVAIGKLIIPPGLIQLAPKGTKLFSFLNGALVFGAGAMTLAIAMSILTYFVSIPMFKKLKASRLFKNQGK